MFSYSNIIKQAYGITRRYPILWLFGMFLVGVSNLDFFQFQNWPRGRALNVDLSRGTLVYFQSHPGKLAFLSLAVLVVSVVSLVLTNWARIMLVLTTKTLLDTRRSELSEQAKQSRLSLWPVIKVSILTSVCMLGALAVLAAPFWIDVDNPSLQTLLWMLGTVIFFPLAFTISCVNIFTGMYVILLKLPVGKALNAGTDFFAANWPQVLALTLLLGVVYLAGFVVGVGMLGVVQILLKVAVLAFDQFGLLHFSWLFIIIKTLGVLALWVMLGILNAFLNTALLLFFLQKITPVKSEKEETAPQAMPSPATT